MCFILTMWNVNQLLQLTSLPITVGFILTMWNVNPISNLIVTYAAVFYINYVECKLHKARLKNFKNM